MSDIYSPMNKEDESLNTLREFFKRSKDLPFKTNLSAEHIGLIIEAEALNKHFNSVWKVNLGYQEITTSFKEHRRSLNNNGFEAAMEVLKAHREALLESRTQRSLMDRLMGRSA